ncbi:MAG: hypothetical protein WB772_16840 [Xanthobacteraceae bacterium]
MLLAPPLPAKLPTVSVLPVMAVKTSAAAAARVETERADLAPADFELAVLVRLPSSQEQEAPPALNCQANSTDERDKHEPT